MARSTTSNRSVFHTGMVALSAHRGQRRKDLGQNNILVTL